MDWHELVDASLARPGMYVRRPYVDCLLTLWHGFSLGAEDGHFDRFSRWLSSERFPAEGGCPSPLAADALVRQAIGAAPFGSLDHEEGTRAVVMLAELVGEYRAIFT